jgi:ribosomal protein S20
MKQLLEKIDKYIRIQEKKEAISLSLEMTTDLKKVIEMVKNSDDKERTISMFSEDVQKQIQDLIDGGIL